MLTVILPFSLEALQGAVRRYLSRPTLDIEAVVPAHIREDNAPCPGIYQLDVRYRSGLEGQESRILSLVLQSSAAPGQGQHDGNTPTGTRYTLLTRDDIVGEPTRPLVVTAEGYIAEAREHLYPAHTGDWVLMEGPVWKALLPGAHWTADQYRTALGSLALQHATWWGKPVARWEHPWFTHNACTGLPVDEARAALDLLECAPWGSRFLSREQIRAWRKVLDAPDCLLDTLQQAPQTLIQWDSRESGLHAAHSPRWQALRAGPAAHDLACFYSSARWWYGRLPMTLAEMRSYYLQQLNDHIDEPVDRYLLDAGLDAARAWRFALVWPAFIAAQHTALGAHLHHLQATVIEPAHASLRRCLA